MVLVDIVMLHWLYLAAKASQVGVDVCGLACPLHCPMVFSHRTRGQSFLLDAAMSHHAVVGGGAFLEGGGGCEAPYLNI
jgi:hypothetical protein